MTLVTRMILSQRLYTESLQVWESCCVSNNIRWEWMSVVLKRLRFCSVILDQKLFKISAKQPVWHLCPRSRCFEWDAIFRGNLMILALFSWWLKSRWEVTLYIHTLKTSRSKWFKYKYLLPEIHQKIWWQCFRYYEMSYCCLYILQLIIYNHLQPSDINIQNMWPWSTKPVIRVNLF